MELQGKVVVVTGGGNGIGQQMVLILLQKGAVVVAVDINVDGLNETKNRAGNLAERLSLHKTDIANRESVSQLVSDVVQQHGCVDAIINNAGVIHPFKTLNTLDYGIIDKVIKVNLYGIINMITAFLPLLLERPVARIVNVSSMGGVFAFPKQTLYGATKAAVKLLSEGLYSELRKTNVGVTVVFPGAVRTNITKNCDSHPEALDKFERFHPGMSPELAAKRIINAIEKNRFRVHIGFDSRFLSVLYRLFPTLTIVMLSKVMEMAMPD